jgi:hypothetical protein
MENISTNMPIVFIIDLDGTLIGNLEPHLCYEEILSFLKVHNTFDNQVLPENTKAELLDALNNGLARPHFKEFYENTKKNNLNSEFFIYTASHRDWAHYIIECLEELHDIKFNRPIFTREDCDNSYKSLRKINTRIKLALYEKYNTKYEDINYIIIDDNEYIYAPSDRKMLLTCPTYKHTVNVDILEKFPKGIVAKHYKDICKILEKEMNMNFPTHTTKMHKTFMKQYKQNIMTYVSRYSSNRYDDFWKKLCDANWI